MGPYGEIEDDEVKEEVPVLYTITPEINEEDLSDLEPDELEDLDDEAKDFPF